MDDLHLCLPVAGTGKMCKIRLSLVFQSLFSFVLKMSRLVLRGKKRRKKPAR